MELTTLAQRAARVETNKALDKKPLERRRKGCNTSPMTHPTPDIIQALVMDVYRHIFPDDSIDTDSDFFDLGGDSLSVVTFCALLDEMLGQEVHPSVIIYFPTVEDLTQELATKLSTGA